MYAALKAPLPSAAVKQHPTKTFLSTIKAIYVTERLNDVFGCGAWRIKVDHVTTNDKSMVVIKTTFEIPEYGVYYECYGGNDNGGENSKNFDLGDAYKGATTDALTKIGSYMGIAIEVFKGNGNTQPQQQTSDANYNGMKAQPQKPGITEEMLTRAIKKAKDGEDGIWEKLHSNFILTTAQATRFQKEINEK